MEKEQQQEAYLFQVTNHHLSGAGIPPQVDDKQAGRYLGYFENEYSEQLIFIYDYSSGQGTLYLGDADWATAYPVQDGKAADLLLGNSELLWLTACWKAATCVNLKPKT
ncbi:MAG: hypothetical protein HXX20_20775 [Chloroflexi bacterium]|nr:hypothetical protein [Chloroflexota bacterium]